MDEELREMIELARVDAEFALLEMPSKRNAIWKR
jgi:hypothetical protein